MDIHNLELDIACYAQGVYHEGSHNIQERIGIINVIRNRVRDGRWGNDVCSVVYASGQFIGVTDESHLPVNERAYLETKLLVIDTIIHKRKLLDITLIKNNPYYVIFFANTKPKYIRRYI